ncbi:hypothetical protein [Endozoicomonas sp. SCSIO W0465]|uniref:hypothetical protein n=1 Tax=Endozoicomonas sp. SCSIO W0465 TaxID=2918516 RepID=UPI00207558C5|nr:hypothetical protein [Endozoicomonas sp. SCSIO W0465]USE34193.1 hypothetical protein MJO57_18725 [Endozoicomonas sp. SCSIO W0465]
MNVSSHQYETFTLKDGSVITVNGESVSVGEKVFIEKGEIKDTAPSLAQYEVEV